MLALSTLSQPQVMSICAECPLRFPRFLWDSRQIHTDTAAFTLQSGTVSLCRTSPQLHACGLCSGLLMLQDDATLSFGAVIMIAGSVASSSVRAQRNPLLCHVRLHWRTECNVMSAWLQPSFGGTNRFEDLRYVIGNKPMAFMPIATFLGVPFS
jgi:hypothetical protein